ncbi:MAG: GNAT family N-acetyltransferase [Maribacter sp.]
MNTPIIYYTKESDLSVREFKQVLINSTLGERRPINDPEHLFKMLKFSNMIVTARHDGRLIGVSRSLTDYAFCTYLSDLAVDVEYQLQGIGKELIRQTKLYAPDAKLILLAAPAAVSYYPRIGMTQHEFCYFLEEVNALKA